MRMPPSAKSAAATATVCTTLVALLAIAPARAQNLGHRLGGDVHPPENTLHCYKRALDELQDDPAFQYVEFDVRETADRHLAVFHDATIRRMVPASAHNRAVLRSLVATKEFGAVRLDELTLAQVERLELEHQARIPTLQQVLDASVKWRLRKPMLVEVKALRTDACREQLLQTVARYRGKLDVNFLAFPSAFAAAFPDPVRWRHRLADLGFAVYTAKKPKTAEFDLARLEEPLAKADSFENVMPETPFEFTAEDARTKRMPIDLPSPAGDRLALRVGIEHGYDDSGDRGVMVRLLDVDGRQLLAERATARGWVWFETQLDTHRGLVLIVEDLDTTMTGNYAGNAGRVKVNLRRTRSGRG